MLAQSKVENPLILQAQQLGVQVKISGLPCMPHSCKHVQSTTNEAKTSSYRSPEMPNRRAKRSSPGAAT
jgi:hypothetical protein